jgi:hypothetical protein
MESFEKYLNEAKRHLEIAEHMTYLTYALIDEKRILLKIFDEIFKVVDNCIKAVFLYESSDDTSWDIFLRYFSRKYGLDEKQTGFLVSIYTLNEKHQKSAMEFVREDKMVIMSDNLGLNTLDIKKIKEYLAFAKEFFKKVSGKLIC